VPPTGPCLAHLSLIWTFLCCSPSTDPSQSSSYHRTTVTLFFPSSSHCHPSLPRLHQGRLLFAFAPARFPDPEGAYSPNSILLRPFLWRRPPIRNPVRSNQSFNCRSANPRVVHTTAYGEQSTVPSLRRPSSRRERVSRHRPDLLAPGDSRRAPSLWLWHPLTPRGLLLPAGTILTSPPNSD
jgi:hypothetical protein